MSDNVEKNVLLFSRLWLYIMTYIYYDYIMTIYYDYILWLYIMTIYYDLYYDSRFHEFKNRFILAATLTDIKNSEQFSGSLFH